MKGVRNVNFRRSYKKKNLRKSPPARFFEVSRVDRGTGGRSLKKRSQGEAERKGMELGEGKLARFRYLHLGEGGTLFPRI